jgi:hypothetical protein
MGCICQKESDYVETYDGDLSDDVSYEVLPDTPPSIKNFTDCYTVYKPKSKPTFIL